MPAKKMIVKKEMLRKTQHHVGPKGRMKLEFHTVGVLVAIAVGRRVGRRIRQRRLSRTETEQDSCDGG